MPLVKIEILDGKTFDYKKALLDSVHRALVEAVQIPERDRMQKLYELKPDNFETAPNMTDKATFIEITMFSGRSPEIKKKLYQKIVDNLQSSPGIDPTDVFIVLHEEPLVNWGIRGGKPASEINFDFKIDI